jgi:hypothetical protein
MRADHPSLLPFVCHTAWGAEFFRQYGRLSAKAAKRCSLETAETSFAPFALLPFALSDTHLRSFIKITSLAKTPRMQAS